MYIMKQEKMSEMDNVKMNLTLPKGFYELLQHESRRDFMKTATWVKRFLMKHLLKEHNTELKGGTNNESQNKN